MDRKRQRIINLITTTIVIIICVIVLIISFAIKARVEQNIAGSTNDPPSTPNTEDPEQPTLPDVNEITEAKFIDLQPTIDKWLATINREGKVGLMIYDLNNSRVAASYHENEVFNVASIYKLLLAYDGYRQITIGAEHEDDIIVQNSDKGQLTLSQCLDLIIRESYNGCADPMHVDYARSARVNSLIRNFEMDNTTNLGLQSTAADITKLLRAYWRHSDLAQSLWSKLSDSMLNQPPTSTSNHPPYDWRQGLPAGFSDKVDVYNKVGWERNSTNTHWNIYADAAILDFTEFKHQYTIAILTSNLSNHKKISQLGQMIEETITMQTDGIVK